MSARKARGVARTLGYSKRETDWFVASVAFLHGRSRTEKLAARKKLDVLAKDSANAFATIAEAKFQVIADWYHLAILHLAETKGFSWAPDFISKRLGISRLQVKDALTALETAGLILKNDRGYQIVNDFRETENIPSRAIRHNHQQMMRKAQMALEEQPFQARDFASVVVAIDRNRVPELKDWLARFRHEFCLEASKGEERQDVYALSMQMFCLTKNEN